MKAYLQKPTARELLFALKCFIAAMLSLYIALRLGLPRPFWAPMATCIVSQAMAGSVFVRGMARLIGTLVGTILSIFLLVSFVNYTVMLCLIIALWVGICMYFSMLKRTTDAYAYTVAGFTVPVIIFSVLGDINFINIQYITDIAIARAEETGIGFFCAIVVHSVIFPQNIGSVVLKRMDQAWKDISQWIQFVLTGNTIAGNTQRLTAAQIISELRLLSANLPFDTSNERWAVANIMLLQDSLTVMIPLITSIEDSVSTLRKANKLSEYWEYLLSNISVWIQQDSNAPERVSWLRKRIKNGIPKITPQASWDEALIVHLAIDLEQLISFCESRIDQRHAINTCIHGTDAITPKATPISLSMLHKDRRLAFFIAASAVFSITLASLFWVVSGWAAGFCAPMMTSIFYLSFVRNDNSVIALKKVLLFTIYSLPIAAFYLLVVIYSVHSFETLMLAFAPCVLIVGTLMARPATAFSMTILMMGIWATITMYDQEMANATSFINGQVFAQCIGIIMALGSAMIFRSFDAEWTTKRLINSIGNDISRLAKSVKSPPIILTTVQMVDRITLIAPRLSGLGDFRESTLSCLFREMRIGLNMVHLMNMRSRLTRNNINIQSLLNTLSDYFNKHSQHTFEEQNTMRNQLDETLHQVCSMNSPIRQNAAIAALTGIRQDLFPTANPYYPKILIPREAA